MVELRYAVPAETTTKAPRLQYRILGVWPAAPSDWLDVPWVVVPEAPQPATSALTAIGVLEAGHQPGPPAPSDGK